MDMAGLASLRPDQHHQPAVEPAGRDEPRLAIVAPVSDDCRGAAREHFDSACEIQSAMLEREITLRRIEADLQLNVPPINVKHGGP